MQRFGWALVLILGCTADEDDDAASGPGSSGDETSTSSASTSSASTSSASTSSASTSSASTSTSTTSASTTSASTEGSPAEMCLAYNSLASCPAPECEWHEGFQIAFDQGACGCLTNQGLCLGTGVYQLGTEREAYVFDGDPERVIVLEAAVDPVPPGLSICDASGGEYCACAVGEANYCDI